MHIQFITETNSHSILPSMAIDMASAGKAIVVDVRCRSEVKATGTARGAMVLPLDEFLLQLENGDLTELGAGRSWIFVCDTGTRSAFAAKAAGEAGLTGTFYLDGLNEWVQNGGAISACLSGATFKSSHISQPKPVEFA